MHHLFPDACVVAGCGRDKIQFWTVYGYGWIPLVRQAFCAFRQYQGAQHLRRGHILAMAAEFLPICLCRRTGGHYYFGHGRLRVRKVQVCRQKCLFRYRAGRPDDSDDRLGHPHLYSDVADRNERYALGGSVAFAAVAVRHIPDARVLHGISARRNAGGGQG